MVTINLGLLLKWTIYKNTVLNYTCKLALTVLVCGQMLSVFWNFMLRIKVDRSYQKQLWHQTISSPVTLSCFSFSNSFVKLIVFESNSTSITCLNIAWIIWNWHVAVDNNQPEWKAWRCTRCSKIARLRVGQEHPDLIGNRSQPLWRWCYRHLVDSRKASPLDFHQPWKYIWCSWSESLLWCRQRIQRWSFDLGQLQTWRHQHRRRRSQTWD